MPKNVIFESNTYSKKGVVITLSMKDKVNIIKINFIPVFIKHDG